MLLEELVSIGFTEGEARRLSESGRFHHRTKTRNELRDLFRGISEIYDCGFEDVKTAILTFPPFAGYDHERVVREGTEVYGDEDKVKKAILRHPQFAGLDHERVVRQKTRLGRLAGLTNEETIDRLLDKPVLAGYSAKRYLAAFDIGRQLAREGFQQDENMLAAFLSYCGKSPYVPRSDKRRISQVPDHQEPPLLTAMRKRLRG